MPARAGKAPGGRVPVGTASEEKASEGRDLVRTLDRLGGSLAGRIQLLVGKAPLLLGCSLEGGHQTLAGGVRRRCCEEGWFHPYQGTHFCLATWQKAFLIR